MVVSPATGSTSTATTQAASTPTTPTSSSSELASAHSIAQRVIDLVGSGKVVELTEDNDPNNLIGRPGGYNEGASIQWLKTCDEIDVQKCGGAVEIWPTEEAAMKRATYIQTILRDMSMLGTEYDYVKGRALLRISGDVKPSQAKQLNVINGHLVTVS